VQTKDAKVNGFVKKLHHNGTVDVETKSGVVTIPFPDLHPLTKVETAYGSGEVKRIGRKEMLQVQLDFGTLYSMPSNLTAVPEEVKETGI